MKYATIGSSAITRQMIDGTREAGFAQLAGVYSRDLENARSFGARYGVSLIFDDLNELAKSDIEAVYVASPNALHYQQCKVPVSYTHLDVYKRQLLYLHLLDIR